MDILEILNLYKENLLRDVIPSGKQIRLIKNMVDFTPVWIKKEKYMIQISTSGFSAARYGCSPSSITRLARIRNITKGYD